MARKSSMARANELTGSFASAKKNIVVQYGDRERKADDIMQLIKSDAVSRGFAETDFDKVDAYIKPEEGKVFYVINGDFSGSIDF